MQHNPRYYYQSQSSMDSIWNNNNWIYAWNPYYYSYNNNALDHNRYPYCENFRLTDYGTRPFVLNINQATKQNNTYRTAIWTGKNLQVTLMSINVGDDIGLEVHPTTDQFIRIEEGQGLVLMGDNKDKLDFQEIAYDDYAIMIPAGKWHNVINTGNKPLKIYAIYAPPEHPYGTVHETKAIAMSTEPNRYY
ncbi:Cupin 2 conserved barrel domain protein [Bacillus cereus 95/8201]|uniref:cupin domain-containing protein n=1 Tax=Bacillus cereus group TaxID=86661 RepID=UPI0001A0954A|nr:cupin domain-containing protein [Bacillus cereus]AJH61141.1 cupin domain protein [Bacillus cereus]AJK32553.1 cupin domain protein [Bacillus cereus]EEL16922.1 Cupin 2 conserved barrel domain protein [Bacillus cereus 95/8201]KWU65988.1 cupin [Bacillus cereus]MDQ4437474.1 cupin domain-containing protein [Bacillus cereus]